MIILYILSYINIDLTTNWKTNITNDKKEIINSYLDPKIKLNKLREILYIFHRLCEEKEIYYLGNYIKKQKESGYILNGREKITEQEFDLKILFFEEEQRQREKNLDLRRKDRNEKEIAEKIKEIEEKYNLEIKRIEEKYNLAIKQYS